MEKIPDPTFSAGVLGKTMGIEPSDGIVYAPFDGTIAHAADTGHALGFVSSDGLELLIHVGVDTVEMGGTGFELKVKSGDAIKAGQPLLVFDRKAVANAGHPDTVIVVVLNGDNYTEITFVPEGDIKAGQTIMEAVE